MINANQTIQEIKEHDCCDKWHLSSCLDFALDTPEEGKLNSGLGTTQPPH